MFWSIVFSTKYIFKNFILLKKNLKHPHTSKKWVTFKKYWSFLLVFNYFILHGKKLKIINEVIKFFILLSIHKIDQYFDISLNYFNFLKIFTNFTVPVFYPKIIKKLKNTTVKSSAKEKKLYTINIIFCKNYLRDHFIKKISIFFFKLSTYPLKYSTLAYYIIVLQRKDIINNVLFIINKKAMNLYY